MSSLVLLLINSSTQINLPCKPTNLNFIARFREKNHVAPGISGTSTLKIYRKRATTPRSIKQFKKI